MSSEIKSYLGDSVYASFDGYAVTIYLDNGMVQQNHICLEPDVLERLFDFKERFEETRSL